MLGRIEIETSDPAMRETFYTALYHACLAPTLFNDADGGYRGLDHKVHRPRVFKTTAPSRSGTPSARSIRC